MSHHHRVSATSTPPERVGVLLVPGIGAGRRGRELLVFAEAVLGWLERSGAPQRETDLLQAPRRPVEVRQTCLEPADDRPPQTVLVVDRGAEPPLELLVSEARWPARLQPPGAGMLGRWLVRVLPFLLLDVADTAVLRDVRRFGRRPWQWWRIAGGLLGLLLAAPLALAVVAVVAGTLLLTWLRIPGFDRLGGWVGLRLSRMFGDSNLLTTSPVQADAAVEAVGREIDGLAGRCPTVAVVAVAQGAAVAHAAVRRHRSSALRLLVTVGSGLRKYHEIPGAGRAAARPWDALFFIVCVVMFLSGPVWVGWLVLVDPSFGRLAIAGLVALVHGGMIWAFFTIQYGRSLVVDAATYALPGAGSTFTWVDYYASVDLVAGGPVIDPTGEPPPGWPREVPVHNRASWFTDHGSYLANVDGFLGDLVPRLLRPSDADRLPGPGHVAATARRFWRVQWLVAARVLVVLTGVAMLVRFYGDRNAIGSTVTGILPEVVTRVAALAVKPFAELSLPSIRASAVGVLAVALATGAIYAVLLMTWRQWDRRDTERYLAGAEPDAGGWAFVIFLAALVATILVAVDAVGGLFRPVGPAAALVAALAAVPLPPIQLLLGGVLAFLAGALYRGTAHPGTGRSADDDTADVDVAWLVLRFCAASAALTVGFTLVAPALFWRDEDVIAPTRLEQLPAVLIGGLAGLAVGEAIRRLRYLLAAHVRPWIARRSVASAPATSWGRSPPRGAALLRTLPTGGAVVRLSPDGRHLLTASAGRAVLRDTRTGRQVCRFPWTGPMAIIDDLVAQAGAGTIRLLPIGGRGPAEDAGGDPAVAAWDPLEDSAGDPDGDEVTALAFAPDGRLLASARAGGVIRVHDVRRRVELWRQDIRARTRDLAVGPGGQVAIAADGRVQLWCPRGSGWELRHDWTDERYPKRVAFDGPGARLAIATSDGAISLRNTASGGELARLAVFGGRVVFHPADAAVVVAVEDGYEVCVWYPDAPSRDVRLRPDHAGEVLDLDRSRDGRHLVVGHVDATTVWRWCDPVEGL